MLRGIACRPARGNRMPLTSLLRRPCASSREMKELLVDVRVLRLNNKTSGLNAMACTHSVLVMNRIYADHGLTGTNRDRPGCGWPWPCADRGYVRGDQAGPAGASLPEARDYPTMVERRKIGGVTPRSFHKKDGTRDQSPWATSAQEPMTRVS